MSSYRRRELREDDAAAVAALFVEGHGESRRMDAGEILEWLDNDALEQENLLVLTRDDDVPYAYFDLWFEPDGNVDIDAAAPGAWDDAYAEAEAIARERGATTVRAYLPDGHEAEGLLEARGHRRIRSSWTMEIDLGVEAPRESALDGVEIRPYRHPEDEQRTYEAHEEAFADHWGHHPQTIDVWRGFSVNARDFDPTLWFLAWAGDEVAGYALNAYERPGDPGYGWVGTLGVRRQWRRRGIGEALLYRSFGALHARGQRRVRLSVDAENTTGATRLYERVGMHVLHASNRWEKTL
jgi:ribosomal protein S18 acetylase RimI-like enzyme